MREFKIGDRVTLDKGWWVTTYEPTLKGWQADGTEIGTITKRHPHPGTLFVQLDDGRVVTAAKNGLTGTGERVPAKPRRKYRKGVCADCGRVRNVTTVYWWVSNTPYVVCGECIRAYRGQILAPCTPECVHNQDREREGVTA